MAFDKQALTDQAIYRQEVLRLLDSGGDAGPGTIVLGTFQATVAGTGYLVGDVLLLRQTPPDDAVYVNTRTGLVVTPSGADLGPVGGASSAVTVTNFPTSQAVTGSVEVENFPAIQAVTGSVEIENFPAIQEVAGSVEVENFPASFQVSNFPNNQAVLQSGNWVVTANAGTNLNTTGLALESGGNLAAIAAAISDNEIQANVLSTVLPPGAATNATLEAIQSRLTPGGVALGAGTTSATTQRVTLASDSPGVSGINTLASAVAGDELQVDVVSSALPNGAATEETLLGIETNSNPGTKVDAATMPAGGVGRIGWLSAIWLHTLDIASKLPSLISGRVPVQITAASATAFASQSDVAAVAAALQPLATEATLDSIDTAISRIDADTSALAGTVAGTELQVDIVGQLPVGNNRIGKIVLTDGTTDISARDLTSANPLDVAIVDSDGNQVSTFGGGTQYTEGDADATITGTAILWEQAGDVLSPVSAANPLPVTGSLSVSNTVALAVFRALASGTGYSTGNIIVLRQTPPAAPEYYNATTNAVIAAPDPADLGPIASSSNVIVDSGALTANAGTNLNTSLLALEGGGNLAAIATALAGTLDIDGSVTVSNFPTTQAVSGTVAVSNHPTEIQVSNLPATQAVSGTVAVSNHPTSIEVSNLPTTQPVSGSVTVSNLPATQPVSGTVAVSNFPTNQAVSGTVNVGNHPTSIQVSNLPATQPVSGTVSVGNLPTIQAVSGSVGVDNFPETQTVDGTVNVGNFPTTQTVSGTVAVSNQPTSIQVSNFPSTQTVGGTVSVGNFPSTQPVSGTVAVNNHPTSIQISNLPATQTIDGSVSVTNFPATQPVSGTVTVSNQPTSIQVSNFPTSQAVSGTVAINNHPTSIEVSNLPATQAVSGTVAVSNQPTSIEISNLPTTQPVSGSVTVSNLPATQPVSGTITANAGSNLNTSALALEDGGNIEAIATAVAGTLDVAGAVTVSNFPGSFDISNFPTTQAVSGAITANAGTNLNTSALALENGGNLAAIASNTAVAIGAGTAAAAQRTTLASDSPGVASLTTIATNTAQGAAITAATMPAGGSGPIGWLSATWVAATALLASVGAPADAAATSDSGTFSLVALFKRSLLRLSNIYAVLCTGTRSGGTADNAVISGTITTPGAGQYIHLTGYSFSFSANPSAARALTITAGGATLANIDVTTGGAGPVSISVSAPANTAVTYSLAASGTAGNIGKLSLYHTTLSVI